MNKLTTYLLTTSLLFSFVINYSQFVENKGQVIDVDENLRPEVKFTYGIGHTGLFFLDNKVVYSFLDVDYVDESLYANNQDELDSVKALRGYTSHRMDMEFVGANSNIEIVKGDKVDGVKHYYLNKRNGIRDVESFSSITYSNMYDNIDVVFYQMASGMKYDFVLKEGANIEDIKINYSGAKALTIENEKLYIETTFETISEDIPLSFINGDKNNEIVVSYFIDKEGFLCFKTKSTDYETLTIDPVMEWATYFNNTASGSDPLDYYSSHLDASGNYYIYGQVYMAGGNYPVISPGGSAYTQSYNNSSEVYIAQFDSDRNLVWSTYMGGSSSDETHGSEQLVSSGNTLHVVGQKVSAGAPFTNGGGHYSTATNQCFWARFNISNGALQHLTSIGSGFGPSIALSSSGQVAIIRSAYDWNATTVVNRAGAYNQSANGGFKDMFLMLMNASYNQIWGTFLGGYGTQDEFMCAFDSNNNLYFVGETEWLSSSNASDERLVTLSGAYNKSTYAGGTDVMLGKFNSSGALVWNTVFGGDGADARRGAMGGYAKLLHHPTSGEFMIFYNTTSTNLPVVNPGGGAYYKTVPTHPGFDGGGSFSDYVSYFAKFSSAGALNYGSYYYSSTGGDLVFDVTFGGCNKLYIAGRTDRTTVVTLPLAGGFNNSTGGPGFVMQLNNNTFASEWSSFLSETEVSNPTATGRSDNPRVYFAAKGYYGNGTTVDPGSSAYFESSNINGSSQSFMIWQLHPTIPPNISGTTTLCSGQTTTLTASGGAGAPYNWYTSSSGGTAFNTGATYTTPALSSNVTYYVSSGSGACVSPRKAVTITVNPGPSAPTISSNSPVCVGGTLNLTSNTVSGATYAWTHNTSSYTSSAEDPTRTSVTAAMAGTYYCTVTIAGCTSASASTAVVVNTPSVAPTGITGTTTICNGVSTTLTLAGGTSGTGATAQWFSGSCGGPSAGTGNSITVSPSSNTTYFVRYNGTCNTTSCASQAVTVNAIPTAPTLSSNTPVCEGTSINLTSNTITGATYAWSGPNSFTSSSEDPSIASATSVMAGDYECEVTVSGCTSSKSTTTVAITAAPVVTVPGSGTVCVGSTITLSPTSGGTWTSSNANATITNAGVVTGVTGGAANMIFENTTTGCSSIGAGGNITVNALPTVTVPGSGEVCVNGNITLSPTTGGTWSSSATVVATITSAGVVTGVSSGNADMTFTNTATGCTSTAASGSVTVNPLEDASFTYPASTYCITSPVDPMATVTGVAGGTFSINNGGTIASITGEIDLDANGVQNYKVYYTTSGTCSGIDSSTVNVTSGPLAIFSYTGTPYCGGTGTADVTYGTGGSAGVFAPLPATTDLVINSTTGAVDLNASLPGTYTVENDIVASGGCAASYATSDITITAQEDATYSYGASTTFCESATNPTATITGTTGGIFTATTAGITVDGTTGEIDLSASTFGATYTVRYITPGTCSDTLDIDVVLESSPTVPTVGTTAGGNTICVGESADITASGSTGTGVTYAVFDAMTAGTNLGTTPLTVSPTTTTTYYVESFNTNGCGNVGGRQAVTVTVNALPTIDAGADETICPTDNVTLTATGTGTVVWSTTETTSSITVTPAITTTYTVTLTDANTCVNTDDVTVTVVTNGGSLVAQDDAFIAEVDQLTNFDVLLNDTYGGNTTTLVLLPNNGTATSTINGSIDYQSDPGFIGTDSLTYEICDVTCATICDTAVVVITVDKTIEFSVPGGFSPNGDNINDIFVIQGLEEYPNNNLSIFNRWGSLMFQAAPYNNDWDGVATEGTVLMGDKVTTGTYFYILELGDGIEPLKGSIEVKRD